MVYCVKYELVDEYVWLGYSF